MKMNKSKTTTIDWFITIVPFLCILTLCLTFIFAPEKSANVLSALRSFFGDTLGSVYILIGLGMFIISIYIAFSKYGKIVLGGEGKAQYSFFKWGSMMFTAGLAADILFYSLCEWTLYASEPHITDMGTMQDWASTYPLFHWGMIPWSFYLVLAVAFGFMLHVRKCSKQKYSEALRPLLGRYVDGIAGRVVDLIAVFALIAGTATTFSLATPLMSESLSRVFGIASNASLTIGILIITCIIYTICAYIGIDGISWLAKSCTYLFFALLIYVLIGGGKARYIIETGITSVGNLVQHFIGMATWTDATRSSSFPQNWTIFYWAYWMVWCVATPFFIGSISKGRTIKQTILGGYAFCLSSTFISFIILGNYGLGLHIFGEFDMLELVNNGTSLYKAIADLIETLPLPQIAMILLAVTMVAFYATSFDSITLVAASYSYKTLEAHKEPSKNIRLFWSVLLILLPIALIFSDSSMNKLQTVSIIAAFPVGIIIVMIVISFFKDAARYLDQDRIIS